MLVRILRRLLASASDVNRFELGQPSTWGSLANLARNFHPAGIIDIGAHKGDWARRVAEIFASVPIHMVEAQAGLAAELGATGYPYTICLLGAEEVESVSFHIDPSWPTGASVMEEVTAFDREMVGLPMRRLDNLETGLKGPLLLKLDVQGYELQVLAGATETLKQTEVILAEVALLEYNKGAPLMAEVVAFLASRGFVPYDFGDMYRRHEDSALFQCDMIFVRADSELRARRKFYAHEK